MILSDLLYITRLQSLWISIKNMFASHLFVKHHEPSSFIHSTLWWTVKLYLIEVEITTRSNMIWWRCLIKSISLSCLDSLLGCPWIETALFDNRQWADLWSVVCVVFSLELSWLQVPESLCGPILAISKKRLCKARADRNIVHERPIAESALSTVVLRGKQGRNCLAWITLSGHARHERCFGYGAWKSEYNAARINPAVPIHRPPGVRDRFDEDSHTMCDVWT